MALRKVLNGTICRKVAYILNSQRERQRQLVNAAKYVSYTIHKEKDNLCLWKPDVQEWLTHLTKTNEENGGRFDPQNYPFSNNM